MANAVQQYFSGWSPCKTAQIGPRPLCTRRVKSRVTDGVLKLPLALHSVGCLAKCLQNPVTHIHVSILPGCSILRVIYPIEDVFDAFVVEQQQRAAGSGAAVAQAAAAVRCRGRRICPQQSSR